MANPARIFRIMRSFEKKHGSGRSTDRCSPAQGPICLNSVILARITPIMGTDGIDARRYTKLRPFVRFECKMPEMLCRRPD